MPTNAPAIVTARIDTPETDVVNHGTNRTETGTHGGLAGSSSLENLAGIAGQAAHIGKPHPFAKSIGAAIPSVATLMFQDPITTGIIKFGAAAAGMGLNMTRAFERELSEATKDYHKNMRDAEIKGKPETRGYGSIWLIEAARFQAIARVVTVPTKSPSCCM